MSKKAETLPSQISPEWADVLRKKMTWLDGFAAAVQNPILRNWLTSFRADLNKMEAGESPADYSEERVKSRCTRAKESDDETTPRRD